MQCMRRCIVCLCLKPMKNSCFECPDRHELCWNTCEKYLAAKARHEEIKASTIIERNPQLQNRLETDSSHKAQLLKRVFSKTWELLRTETDLQRVYKDIQLPDPKDPAFIPTVKNLDSLVFTFPHGGKKEAP